MNLKNESPGHCLDCGAPLFCGTAIDGDYVAIHSGTMCEGFRDRFKEDPKALGVTTALDEQGEYVIPSRRNAEVLLHNLGVGADLGIIQTEGERETLMDFPGNVGGSEIRVVDNSIDPDESLSSRKKREILGVKKAPREVFYHHAIVDRENSNPSSHIVLRCVNDRGHECIVTINMRPQDASEHPRDVDDDHAAEDGKVAEIEEVGGEG